MKKNEHLESWLDAWDPSPDSPIPREYRAFFFCFNSGQYYEAHDVLEHLWLRNFGADRSFYQALIQLAGAFVHFRLHALFPDHPTHSRRIAPGCRLLELAQKRFLHYPSTHLGLNLTSIVELCELWIAKASQGNPLHHNPPPQLSLSPSYSGP